MRRNQFNRGDIISVCLNPTIGKEIQGENRPALVVSSRDFHQFGVMMIAPITQGNADIARNNGFAVTLSGTGCKTQGIILAYQVRVIDFVEWNAKKIETVPEYIVTEVQDIIEAITKD